MTVRVEKQGGVWTVIHSRPEARNAMDPASAEALVEAFLAFDRDPDAKVAVLWGEGGAFCTGFDLKHAAGNSGALDAIAYPPAERARADEQLPRGPDGAYAPRAGQAGDRRDRRAGGGGLRARRASA